MTRRHKIYVWSEPRRCWKTAYAKDAESFYRTLEQLARCGLKVKGRILE